MTRALRGRPPRAVAQLVLASASPRRKHLLQAAGLHPVIRPAHVDEAVHNGEEPLAYVERVAFEKARGVERATTDIVLAADTTIVLDGLVIGKPADEQHARLVLQRLSGRIHVVATGVAVIGVEAEEVEQCVVTTKVQMAELSEARIRRYVATGEPAGKAGGYAIQGRGAALIESLEGSWTNVVGLPLVETLALLRNAGLPGLPGQAAPDA